MDLFGYCARPKRLTRTVQTLQREYKTMNLQQYSESAVERTPDAVDTSGKVGVLDIASILAIVLPILSNLPCFAPKTAAEKREWVENHPSLAVAHAAQEIRRQAKGKGEKTTRKHAKSLATTVINDYLSTPDEDIVAMGINI